MDDNKVDSVSKEQRLRLVQGSLQVEHIVIGKDFFEQQRQALLMQVDAIERMLGINPRTAELRKKAR